MSTPPFVRFYANDWFTGCAGLKADERGVYVSMCVYVWTTGKRVPLDDAEASRMMNLNFKSYQRIRDRLVVIGKVTRHENGYGNDRAEHELAAASEAATAKGRAIATPDRSNEGRAQEAAKPGPEAAQNAQANGSVLIDGTIDSVIDHMIDPMIDVDNSKQNQTPSIEPEPVTRKKEEDTPLPPIGGLVSEKPEVVLIDDGKPNPHIEALNAFTAYNDRALVLGLPQASKLTPDRRRRISARLKDFGPDGWVKALANLDTPFLRGKTEHRFKADLDFVCQAKSFSKLHDGGYAPAEPTPGETHAADRNRPSRYPTKHDRLQAVVAGCIERNAGSSARPEWARDLDGDAVTVLPSA